jgi:hypothetical protein
MDVVDSDANRLEGQQIESTQNNEEMKQMTTFQ